MSQNINEMLNGLLSDDPNEMAAILGMPSGKPVRAVSADLSIFNTIAHTAYGFGDPLQEIVDLVFESEPERLLPGRALFCNAVCRWKFGVPVRSAIVLLRPEADSAMLTGTYSDDSTLFQYDVLRLWQRPANLLLHPSFEMLPLGTICQSLSESSLHAFAREIVGRIDDWLKGQTQGQMAAHGMDMRPAVRKLGMPYLQGPGI